MSNVGVVVAKENLERFFDEWEIQQRKLARDQRNAVAFFVNEAIKEFEQAVAAYVPRMDALRAENGELQRQLEAAQHENRRLRKEIEAKNKNDTV